MKLQREDIHPVQDMCPYFESVGFNLHGFNLHEIGTESVRKLCLLRRLADPLLSPFFRVLRVFRG